MKQSRLILFVGLLAAVSLFQPTLASAAMAAASPATVSDVAPAAHALSKKQSRKIERLERRFERIAQKHGLGSAFDISIDDPANQWLVRWLVLWGIGLVVGIASPYTFFGLWYLAGLIWTLGTVCAIIWILKITDSI